MVGVFGSSDNYLTGFFLGDTLPTRLRYSPPRPASAAALARFHFAFTPPPSAPLSAALAAYGLTPNP